MSRYKIPVQTQQSSPFVYLSTKNNETYGVVGFEADGTICFWNAGAKRITGFEESDVIGKNLCSLFYTPDDIAVGVPEAELGKALKDGHSSDHRWHLKKDGGRFWATGAISRVHDEAGELLGLCKMFQDDTVRKMTEEKILSANLALTQIASIAAHDLRQPLRTVRTYLQLLGRKADAELSEDSKGILKTVLDTTLRMDTLIRDVLSMSDIQNQTEKFEEVSCNNVVDLVVSSLHTEILNTNAAIVRTSLPCVLGVASQLGRLFQNLFSNALKFRAKDRELKIEVAAKIQENEWIFCVQDNGIGIDENQRHKIFEMFSRLHSHDEYEGSGLGLAICKTIVEQHGGKIWVESKLGAGSSFCFSLPVSLDPTRPF